MVDEAAGDGEKLAQDKTRLTVLSQRYREFSKAAGLRTQEERTEVAGFGEESAPRQGPSSPAPKLPEAAAPPRLEIPTDTEPPAPQSETGPENAEQSAAHGLEGREDVTEQYIRTATPGQGTLISEDGYVVKKHRDEIKMARWLRDTFGGDVKLLKESNVKNQETPDFLWRGKMWELKGASSINGADKLLQHAIKQIQDNPGGVILNILQDVDMDALEWQLTRRFRRSRIDAFDLMILSKDELSRILRYKK